VQATARTSARRTPPLVRPVTLISGVLVVLALLLAPYVRPWLAQRSAITAGAQEVARLQAEVSALEEQRRRWDDPAFIRAEARERLHMAMPGETVYRRLAPPTSRVAADPRAASAVVPDSTGLTWWQAVGASVVRAGDPAGR
jgi:cell division protein FtsB